MSKLVFAFAIIYLIICICTKKPTRDKMILGAIVWMVISGLNLNNAMKLNEEMNFYKDYYSQFKEIIDGMADVIGYNDLPKTQPDFTETSNVSNETAENFTPTPGSLIYSKSGKGDSIIQSVSVTQPSYMVFNTSDDRHHDVKAWYGSGEYDYELLVNSSDPYFGSTYLLGDNVYDFEIKCMGNWSVEIYSIGYTADTEFSGKGDYVTEIFQPATQFYYITYTGSDHFAVKQRYGTGRYDYELLVNQSEPYSGTVRLSHSDLPCFFEISGEEGNWTITPGE